MTPGYIASFHMRSMAVKMAGINKTSVRENQEGILKLSTAGKGCTSRAIVFI